MAKSGGTPFKSMTPGANKTIGTGRTKGPKPAKKGK